MKRNDALRKPLNASPRFSGRLRGALILLLAAAFGGVLPAASSADTAAEIQAKIAQTNTQIAALEKEIAEYENELAVIGGKKKTLQNEINRIDVSRKRIATDISVTQAKITKTSLTLETLGTEITDKEERIDANEETIGKSLRSENQLSGTTLIEHLLTARGLSEAWEESSRIAILNAALRETVNKLTETKQLLTEDFNATKKYQRELIALRRELSGQQAALDVNRREKSMLLSQTKNTESAYQKLLAEKQQAKLEFERQLSDYEATLEYSLDPTAIPKAGSGVISFPLDPSYMARCRNQNSLYGNIYCITQYFGNTAFARSGAYNGQGHNGIDLGAPEGTRVVAALTGTVVGTGNTDLQAGCYSYGKWVLVEHGNGLATMYAHLSVMSVSAGDKVAKGQLLGYSGKTGYATGPHLHFGLYVADQVKVLRLGDVKVRTNCSNIFMPVAPTAAYLNPISYL